MTPAEIELMKNDLKANDEAVPQDFTEWFWYGCKEKLAGGDILKIKEVGKQRFLDCIRLLAYWDKRDKDQIRELKRQRESDNLNTLRNF